MRGGSLWNGSTLADYFYIVRGEDPDGISLTPALSKGEGEIYNLIGQRITPHRRGDGGGLQKGINIIRYSDGTSKKVAIK